jgi:hypothetical protein
VLVLRRSQAAMKKLERLVLNRIPFGIIWWLDGHLNHRVPPKIPLPRPVALRLCRLALLKGL